MIPVVLFVYKRLDILVKTLEGLKVNHIPKLIVYSDGPRKEDEVDSVNAVRRLVESIEWCDVECHFSGVNLGLGKSIMHGVSETLVKYESCIVYEDDIVSMPGTYKWLCAALDRYKDDNRVYSVTAWTNRRITPLDVKDAPFFNGRADSLAWATWRRAWEGMENETAFEKMSRAIAKGINPYNYGGDLPYTARIELKRNLWAVRFCYHHIVNGGLALHPPWSLVNHIGWGDDATNENASNWIDNGDLCVAPPIPSKWPEPVEHPHSAELLRNVYVRPWSDRFPLAVTIIRKIMRICHMKG